MRIVETKNKQTTDMLEKLLYKAKKTEVDLRKFDNGNAAAGIRARRTLQEVKDNIKIIRAEIQKIKKARKIKKLENLKKINAYKYD